MEPVKIAMLKIVKIALTIRLSNAKFVTLDLISLITSAFKANNNRSNKTIRKIMTTNQLLRKRKKVEVLSCMGLM